MANNLSNVDVIAQKLDTLIRIQARIAVSHLEAQKDRILFLTSAGLAPKDVGEVLGISPNSVSVTLHQSRKQAKGPSKDKPATGGASR